MRMKIIRKKRRNERGERFVAEAKRHSKAACVQKFYVVFDVLQHRFFTPYHRKSKIYSQNTREIFIFLLYHRNKEKATAKEHSYESHLF